LGVVTFTLTALISWKYNQNQELCSRRVYRFFILALCRLLQMGRKTYGGGRYWSLSFLTVKPLILDFNKDYNLLRI